MHYNEEHHITPRQIVKNISLNALKQEGRADTKELIRSIDVAAERGDGGSLMTADPIIEHMTRPQMEKLIAETTRKMKEAAKQLDFLQAAQYRDEIIRLQNQLELK
jgi:excinuclease ABC subunit B